jgi:hypothetical protein
VEAAMRGIGDLLSYRKCVRIGRCLREWTLISWDGHLARVAEECRVRMIGARQFAAQLQAPATDAHRQPRNPRRN